MSFVHEGETYKMNKMDDTKEKLDSKVFYNPTSTLLMWLLELYVNEE